MNTKFFARSLAVACAGALVAGAFVAAPAAADPAANEYGQLVVFGSDTTQDVMQGLSGAVNVTADENLLANYLAVGSSTVQIDAAGTVAPRANGSSAGRDMLRVAIGQAATATIARKEGGSFSANSNVVGQIQAARSSSGVGSSGAVNGVLAYVPFAKDALTMAVKDGSPLAVVPWYIGKGVDTTTTPALTAVYKGAVTHAYIDGDGTVENPYTYVGVGASAELPVGAPEGTNAIALRPVVPQSGSGTRSYFIVDVLGLKDDNTGGISSEIRSSKITIDSTVYDVQEHDGTVMGLDEAVIGPFSIGQFVAFTNYDTVGQPVVTDRRNGASLLPLKATEALTAQVPFVDAGNGLVKANPSFVAATRDVYNIVPSRKLDDPSTIEHRVFNGPESLICQEDATIELYGFVPIDTCGDDTIRAYAPSADNTSTVTWVAPTGLSVGQTQNVLVTVDSKIHRQGGRVNILSGSQIVGTATVAPHVNAATAEVSVPVLVDTTSVSVQLSAVFIPTLAGVTGSVTPVATVPVTQETTTRISSKRTSTIGQTFTVVGWVDGAQGGSLELYDGGTRLQSYTLDSDERGAAFAVVARKVSYNLQVRYVPAAATNVAPSVSGRLAVAVAKATPIVTATAPTVLYGTAGRVTVTVAPINGIVPTGRVEVRSSPTGPVLGSGTLSAAGTVAISLSRTLTRATRILTVLYVGNTLFNQRSTTVSFTVR